MRIGLYTVPGTGTRFVSSFLRETGIDFSQRHTGSPRTCPEWRHITTVRNPYDCYLTHQRRKHTHSDEEFIAMWGNFIWRTQWQDCFYFALDVVPENRLAQLQSLLGWCRGGFDPKDLPIMKEWAESWKEVGKTKKGNEPFPEHMKDHLGFAKEWYDHYTVFWGPRVRNSDNLLGEGR